MICVLPINIQINCISHEISTACCLTLWTEPMHPMSSVFVNHIRSNVIAPYQDKPPNPLTVEEVTHPEWVDMGGYKQVMSLLMPYAMGKVCIIINGVSMMFTVTSL